MKRSVGIMFSTVCLVLVALGGLGTWKCWTDGQSEGRTGSLETHGEIFAPVWEVGDWFAFTTSYWGLDYIAATWEGPLDDLSWGRPRIERSELVREETLLGYRCFVANVLLLEPPQPPGLGCQYRIWMRASDLATLRFVIGPEHRNRAVLMQAAGPLASGTMNILPFPAFPLGPELNESCRSTPVSADGKAVVRTEEDGCLSGTTRQIAEEEVLTLHGEHVRVARVTLSEGLGETFEQSAVVRWAPGSPWWVQAWKGRNLPKGRANYRAALQATSEDVVEVAELERLLPEKEEGVSVSVETTAIPEKLRGVLTAYHRTQRATITRGPQELLTVWAVLNRFDDKCNDTYRRLSATERVKGALPELIAEGRNYRLFVSKRAEGDDAGRLIQAIHDKVRLIPELRVFEGYPLPRAAPGGRILEP